jgi:glycosyltransferase involved in cell wall biosynthesis
MSAISPSSEVQKLKVIIVSHSASVKFGGEAIHPVHYFRILRSRGIDAWLVGHGRDREELLSLFPNDRDRLCFAAEGIVDRLLWWCEKPLPKRLSSFSFGLLSRLWTQILARRIIRRLVIEKQIDVVHQPIPLAAKEASLFYDLGAPLVIGPLNGAMDFPPAFRQRQSAFEAFFMKLGRWGSDFMNRLMPGKLNAATVLVANERTRAALPSGIRGKIVPLIDNCVDLATWKPADRADTIDGQPARFVYLGRLVDWKAVDLLLEAFVSAAASTSATLDIVGDGELRSQLEAQAERTGIKDRVRFLGWRSQEQCAEHLRTATALVLPSLYECGGAVVLEAMACGLAVIATNWGGPADYLNNLCGILVDTSSRENFINGLSSGMSKLALDPALAARMGAAGRDRVVSHFDWQWKVDRTLEIYAEAARRYRQGASKRSVDELDPVGAGEVFQ